MSSRLCCAALLCWVPWMAMASTEHDRISSERKAAEAKFAAQQRECAPRFVVSSCVEAAQKERRFTLNRLRQEEIRIDEAKRLEAAAARRQSIGSKAEAQQARASEPAPAPLRARSRQAPSSDASPASGAPGPLGPRHEPARRESAAERLAAEKEAEAKFEARSRAAAAHRADVERRNEARKARGKVAPPLPSASAASAPR